MKWAQIIVCVLCMTLDVRPNSKPQELFLAASEYEILYGGSAGGGKTEALIIDPLRYVQNSDFRAIIFRESYTELERAVLPEAKKLYFAAGASWNVQKKRFTFPSSAFIDLGYLQNADDWTNYQGTQYTGQYFDELTNILWMNYEKLSMWNRSPSGGIAPYRRAASNPRGVSHTQVKEYFVETCPPVLDGAARYSDLARMYWQPMRPGKTYTWTAENGMKLTRKFIPARVFDNEDLLRNNPNYLAQLLAMPTDLRKAYLEGDWDVFEGQFFSDWRKEIHVVPPIDPSPDWARCGILDYGERTVLEVQCRDFEGNIINFAECYTESMPPMDRFAKMADLLIERKLYGLKLKYDTNMDLDLRNYTGYDKTPAQMMKEVFREKFRIAGLEGKEPKCSVVSKTSTEKRGYRAVTNEVMKEYLSWKKDEMGNLTKRPKFYVTSDCKMLIRTLPELIHDPDSPDGLDFDQKVGIDDPYDAAKMGIMELRTPRHPEPEKEYNPLKERIKQDIRNSLRKGVKANTI